VRPHHDADADRNANREPNGVAHGITNLKPIS
jgi:hypothetical protein